MHFLRTAPDAPGVLTSFWGRARQLCRSAAIILCLIPGACRNSPGDHAPDIPQSEPSFERSDDKVVIPANSALRSRLSVDAVSTAPVQHQLIVPATVETDPARTARILPPLAGRIAKLDVRFGDSVSAGQPLLELDSPDFVAAESDLVKARRSLLQAESNLMRTKTLNQKNAAPDQDVEHAQTDCDLAKSDVERTAARLKLLGSDPDRLGRRLTVRSPIAGRIVDFTVALGEYHNDQNAPLMTIADLSTVWVTANVHEKDIRLVTAGQEATATLVSYPGETLKGRVLFVGDLLDPDTRTIKVRVAFDNASGRLKPGMYATVTFTSAPVPQITIPTTALIFVDRQNYVFVETGSWTFQRRPVETGEIRGDRAVIVRGLAENDRIVTRNAVQLQ